jgi:hypothetical protein
VRVAIAIALTIAAPAVASAQLWGTLDIGGATVRYDDSLRVTATTVTPRIRFDDGALAGAVVGTLSSLTRGGWTAQGVVDLSLLSGTAGPFRFELGGETGGSLHDDATRTGQYLGRARLHIGASARGLWAGAATGKTWDASLWHRIVESDFGAWARVGHVQLVATVRPSAVGDSLRYTDVQGAFRRDASRVELSAGVGTRSGDAIARESPTVWGSVSATLWLARSIGLVAAGGTYPVDFTQGYPGGRYLSVALRFGARSTTATLQSSVTEASASRRAADGRPRAQFVTAPNGRRTIRVHAPAARSIDIMADFTSWETLALARTTDGWWAATLAIAPGTYQLNVRVNGGPWDVPAGLLETIDEFGARVGVIDLR